MAAAHAMFTGEGLDLAAFVQTFGLSLASFLHELKRAGAVVTGADVVSFMAGEWKESLRLRPRAVILDVLCHGYKARGALALFLTRSGYRLNPYACRHRIGEWASVRAERRVCLVKGDLSQRVIHLVELQRPVEEVLLSRIYGTLVGNYITGVGRIVSLFPRMSFVERRGWFPSGVTAVDVAGLTAKYVGWRCLVGDGDEAGDEVTYWFRKTLDRYCWVLRCDLHGHVQDSQRPALPGDVPGDEMEVSDEREASRKGFAVFFPQMKASLNAGACVYDRETWECTT
ncbi:Uu.00g010920.m01.CDS01 [Anthostomella pinea]|uniref:Uu.00g010920.m01.CDS01 n=1 Tax=Anthostomella pinea TaxID=933095 RepID=A0AAI8VYW8_9PEZI|nr:Uu.00g010920.m01.CDS01 [Anthostomella pinea]